VYVEMVVQQARELSQAFFRVEPQVGADFHLPTGKIDPHG
jgi:hypothetical protein